MVKLDHGNFVIKPPEQEKGGSWIVIRNMTIIHDPKLGCQLNIGDRIKLGKHEFKILEIQSNPNAEKELLSKLYVKIKITISRKNKNLWRQTIKQRCKKLNAP